MARHYLVATIITLITASATRAAVTCSHAMYWHQIQTSTDTASIINLMCNSISEESKATNDACYGCFSRALYTDEDSTFSDITNCISTYMSDTVYQPCVNSFLNESTVIENSTSKCSLQTVSFCTFEKCVRRIDRNKLVRACIEEVHELAGEGKDLDQVQLYINTTACILSKISCKPSLQENGMQYRSWSDKYYSLFVAGEYDLRVVQMPYGSAFLTCGVGTVADKPVNWEGEKC